MILVRRHRFGCGVLRSTAAGLVIVCLWVAALSGQRLYGQAAEQPDIVKNKLRFARGLMARAFHDMAATELQSLLKEFPADPRAPEATFYLIECLRAQAKSADALALIEAFRKRWPDHALLPQLNLATGDLLLRLNKYDDATRALRSVIDSADLNLREPGLFLLGQALESQGKTAAALVAYKQLAGLPFEEGRAYRPYAVLAIGRLGGGGTGTDAAACYGRLATAEGVPVPLREEARYRLAEDAFNQGKWQEAATHFRTLREQFPAGRYAATASKHELWALVAAEAFEDAIALARELAAATGGESDAEIAYLHGAALMGIKDPAAAVARFQTVRQLKTAPTEHRRLASYQLLLAYVQLKQLDAVAPVAEAFLETYPDAAEAADVFYLWARSLAPDGAKEWQRVHDLLSRALEKAPNDWASRVDARLVLADALAALDRKVEAAGVYRALAEDPAIDSPAYYLLKAGDWMVESGDIKRAVADYRAALKAVSPETPTAQTAVLKMARLYAEHPDLGGPDEAIQGLIDTATPVNRPQLLLLLGYSRFMRRDFEGAEAPLQAVIADVKQGRLANQARNLLGAALLEQEKSAEALVVFATILRLPDEARPDLTAEILFRLLDLYFRKGDLEVCQQITVLLAGVDDPATVLAAALRQADIFLALGKPRAAIEALDPLLADDNATAKLGPAAIPTMHAILGEAHLMLGDRDRALVDFEKCLDRPAAPASVATRARWGMATILFQEERNEAALRHAVAAFVLGNDARYTPRAMLLAIEILVRQKNLPEAVTTWQEMRQRYPAAAEQYADLPLIKGLPTAPGPPE